MRERPIVARGVRVWWTAVTHLGGLPAALALTFLIGIADRVAALRLLAGIVLTFGSVAFIRAIHYKPRPEPQPYTNWLGKLDSAAFPSLHAARVTTIAVVLVAAFGAWLLAPLASLAVLVMASRIALRRHDRTDVLAGAILGLVLGLVVAYVPLPGWLANII
jgi:membrane-associated phospholipid phosphatase